MKLVKTNMQKFAGRRLSSLFRSAGLAKLCLPGLLGLMVNVAWAQPVNDNFTNATVISGPSGTITGSNVGATMETPCEPVTVNSDDYGPDPVASSVWYQWTASGTGTVQFNTTNSDFDTVLAVYTTTNGLCDPSLTFIGADDDSGGNTASLLSFPVTNGVTYYICVESYDDGIPGDNQGSLALNWNTHLPTVQSGNFQFTSAAYVVSVDDGTARITVTRTGNANGRVMVGYAITNSTYTDTYTTNYYGTNTSVTITTTNGTVNQVNTFFTNIVSANVYQVYNNGVLQTTEVDAAQTNELVISNGITILNRKGALTPVPTDVPLNSYLITNNPVSSTDYYGLTNFYFATNVYFTTNVTSVTTFGVPASTNSATNFTVTTTAFTSLDIPDLIETNGFNVTNETDITNMIVSTVGPFVTNSVVTSVLDPSSSPAYTNSAVLVRYPVAITNTVLFSYIYTTNQLVPSSGILPISGTLTFDDFEMSQDIIVPVALTPGGGFGGGGGLAGLPSLSYITLTNAQLDTNESPDLIPPTIDPVLGTALINVLSPAYPVVTTYSVFNLSGSRFNVEKDQVPLKIGVTRTGSLAGAVTVDYAIDPGCIANNSGGPNEPLNFAVYCPGNTFPLTAGSDYATPNSDYTPVTGTLSWDANKANTQTITIPILNNGLVEFDEDFQVQLYNPGPTASGASVGSVNSAIVTVLYDGEGPQPVGAVDRNWNLENSASSIPPFIRYPGTAGNGGTVYAEAEQPDGKVIVAGSFNSFDQNPYNRIVRLLNNGYQDTTFLASPNSGANDFIAALALQPDGKIIIAGNFTAFNGVNRHHIARLNADGSLDTTFNPGLGANGMVWSVALETNIESVATFFGTNILQTNLQVVIGGEFTSVNGTLLKGVARLNPDGSVDTSFNPGAGPDGNVNAIAVDAFGRVIIGGNFDTVAGVSRGGVARLNVDGSLDATFSPGVGTYNSSTGSTDPVYALAIQSNGQILIAGGFSYFDLDSYNGIARLNLDGTLDQSFVPGTGTFNPLTGFSDVIYNLTLQPDGNILIGGDFTTYNQTRRVGIARLFPNGSLDTSFLDTAYNQFAGLINHYHNPDAVNPLLYPVTNDRNFVYAIALESGGNVIIGGSFSYLGGGYNRTDTRGRSNVARLIGGSLTGPGNIEFYYNSYTADKDIAGNGLFVSLTRTNGNLGIINATFSTNTAAPGPGIASANDFSLNPAYATPTWTTANPYGAWLYDVGIYGPNFATIPVNAYNGAADVYINIIDDTNITGNLNANFALSSPSGTNFFLGGEAIPLGAALGTLTTAPLTIIDDNSTPGVLSFSSPNYYVIDNAGTATITVTRTGGSDGVVQVSYATGNGTATNGIDYTGVTNTLTLNQGVISKTFTIPLIAQSSSTAVPDRTVKLRLFTATGGATLGLTNAVLTINNHNFSNGHISFTSATFGTNENAGFALVTVNRLGGSSGAITVNMITSDGTATNGVNYIGSTNMLSWSNLDVSVKTISIPVKDDGIVTSNLTVFLQLTNALLNTQINTNVLGLSLYTTATLYITNVDSSGTVQFTAPAYSVKKYGGFALIPVVRIGGISGTDTVNYATADGTAVAGINYSNVSGTLTFTNGETGKFFPVPIIDDGTNDGLKSFTVTLSNASPTNALGTITNATVNIIDTEPGENFPTVNEPPGSPDVTYLTLGLNNTVYAMALQPNNQLLVGGDFTFADGVPRQRIARLNSDGTLDAKFSLPSSTYGASDSVRALAVQTNGLILVGGLFTNINSVVMNHIARLNPDGSLDSLFNPGSGADNPVNAVAQTFVGGQSKILIGGSFATVGGTPINGIARLNDDGSQDSTFNPGLGANATVYALAVQPDGKVVLGGDFTAVNGNTNFNHIARLNIDGSIDTSFNPGIGANDSVRAITLQLNGEILLGGLFTNVNGTVLNHIARLNSNGSVDSSFKPGLGANDAVFSIALQTDSRMVLGGEFTLCSGVTRNSITRLNPDGTVDPTINFGTGANSFVAAIAIQEDTVLGYPTNVPDEKIIIGGGFTQYNGQPHPYLARLYGGSIGGSGAFEFTSANYQADENSSNAIITIIRTGGTSGTNSNGSGDILVPVFTSNGTAQAGTNYIAVTNNLDFPEGEVLRSFAVPLIDDMVITPNLTVNLAVNPVPPAEFGDQPTALLTIINDDSEVNFSSATYSAPKNAVNGAATVNIVRTGSTQGTAMVYFTTTAGGTAIIGTDYYPTNEAVIFNPGVSNVAVTIPIINNGVPEGNQTVTMNLSSPAGTLLYSPSNAVLTIIDTANAPGQLSFSATNYVVTEAGSTGYTSASITVVRTNGAAGTISVGYSTADGTAVAGVKYLAANGVVTFGEGETAKTFVVQVVNTTTAEGPEYLSLLLSNPTGGATLAVPISATLTILNTNIGIAFAAATNIATEPFGSASNSVTLNVLRLNGTNGTTTVNYSTTNGTAVAGTNYTASSGTVTFTNGQSVQAFTIPLLYDPLVTGDLNFTVGLSSPSAGAQLVAPTSTTVIVQDADAGLSFATNATTVFKNTGIAFIPVLCSNTNVEPVSVHYSTSPGTAVAGVDYKSASGTLTFTNGQAVNYFTVPIIGNNLVESNRNFTVTLSSPTSPGQIVPPSSETVTIIETNSPYGLSFFTPLVLSGDWGSTNLDNTFSAPELGDPNIAGFTPNAPVWFQWTAPSSGEVELDTIGSYATNGVKLDTVLSVFTGTSLTGLNLIAANDDLYPQMSVNYSQIQENYTVQNIYNTNALLSTNLLLTLPFEPIETYYNQPYGGPSGLRFNAKAGTTYYFVADTKPNYSYTIITNPPYYLLTDSGVGPISLNWAYHPSGVFRFATEDIDQTGLLGTNGNPLLLYQCAETEADGRVIGPVNAGQYNTTLHTYYDYNAPGLLVTVTRVAGSSGRVAVDYTTVDGNTNLITNGDGAAVEGLDYQTVSGTLVFDDFEMSKTILIPIFDDDGVSQPNRDFTVVLSNPRRDPAESADVSSPRVDSVFGQVLCRILDCDIDPQGAPSSIAVSTNTVFGTTNVVVTTNVVISLVPTNSIFNFSKANYRVPRDVQSAYWHGTPVTVYVNQMGPVPAADTKVFYRFDNYFLDTGGAVDDNIYFPLQPGSDYATPAQAGDVIDSKTIDFNPTAADGSSVTFAKHKFASQPINFTVNDNNLTEFNEDVHIDIFEEDAKNDNAPYQCGMVDECTVTILFDDLSPPAGSVDEFWNPDYGSDLAIPTASIGSSVGSPGTEAYSEVYGLALTANNKTVIGGAFATYTDGNNTYTVNGITRLNVDGSRDLTFNSGTGVNVFPGGEFIRSVALTASNQVVIGGHFTSYNGIQRNSIARLNADGSLDTTFTPGAGANGTVWSVVPLQNGQIMIGGDFTTYNGVLCPNVARLNGDGSLDTTFNPGNLLSGSVYAMAGNSATVFNITRNALGTNEDDQTINLGAVTAGALTVRYNTFTNDEMRVFYGDTNVAAGTGVLIYDTGIFTGNGAFAVPFGPVGGLTTNLLTIVMDQGGTTNSTEQWQYNASVSVSQGILVGGKFSVSGQLFANIARLNYADGSLDTTFNAGTGPNQAVRALAVQPDGKILAGGEFTQVAGQNYNRIVRFNSDGSLDANFFDSSGADGTVYSIMLQADGTMYVGGAFTSFNGTHRLGFARLYADGTVDTTFMDTAYNQLAGLPRIHFSDPPGTVYASGVQSDGNVMIVGSFSQVGGGQFDKNVRPGDYAYNQITETYTFDPNFNAYLNLDVWPEPKSRDGVRNRGNVARLIGGVTPGPGNIGMAASSYTVNKTDSFDSVGLVRTNGTLGYASANFSVLPSLAQSGVDYSYGATAPTYPIEWEYIGPTRMHSDGLFGSSTLMNDKFGNFWKFGLNGPASVLVSIINNSQSAGNLSAQYQLANPSGADQFYLGGQDIPIGVALAQSVVPLSIVDNSHQDGVFGFAASSFTATNSSATVGIVRTNSSSGTVQVSYTTVTNGSTAVVGTDYNAASGTLTFNPGQTNSSFPVAILENGYIASTEKTVNLQLNRIQDLSSGNASLGLTNALLRIINPSFQGYLNFSTNAYSANLSAGVMVVTVTRTVGSSGTLTVQFATTNGTAVSGTDYIGSTNTLTWNSGDVSPRNITIPLVNGNTIGSSKQFSISLFNAKLNGSSTPSLLGAVTNATLTIVNDNSYGTFQFNAPSYRVNENGVYATITVIRTGSALGSATIYFTTADGTAFAGTNYYATNGILAFTNGVISQSFNVRILDDGKQNPPPAGFYFNVGLTNVSTGAMLGSPTNATVNILDAESYNQPSGSPDPAFSSTAGFNDSVFALALQSDGQIVAGGNFTVANGTAINRVARLNTDGTLDTDFMNGLAGADSSVNAVVSQTDDRIVVGGSFANINGVIRHRIARLMTDGSLDTSFNPGSGADNTIFGLAEAFINGSREIYVGGAFSTINGLSSPGVARLNNDGSVDTSFVTGLGANGTIYAVAAYPSNSISNVGKVLVGGAFTNFNHFVVANLVRLNVDGSVDTNFGLNITNISFGASGAVRAIAIQADGSVLIGGDFTNVNGTVVDRIARLNANGSLDTNFVSSVGAGANGSVNAIAVQSDNRIVVAGDFTQANGVTRNSITRLLPSGAVDPTINFGEGANSEIDALVIQPADGMLVIGGGFTQFDDQPHDHIARLYGGSITGSGTFQFTSAGYQIDERGSYATINVIRNGGTSGTNSDGSGDVFINFTTSDGTAKSGVNYTGVSSNLDFPPGEVLKTILIPVMDDFVITNDLTVNLTLSNPTPPAGIGNQSTALLTIINDDSAVNFLSANYSIPKNTVNGVATIDIIRQGTASGTATVNFSTTTNGTAIIGTDYYPTNVTVTFNPGDTDKTVQIPIINNTLPEGSTTVTMQLTSAAGALIYSPSNAVLTIIDTVNAPGQLSFDTNSYVASEGGNNVTLTVVRTLGSSGPVSVNYNTVPGTAVSGVNYVTTSGTVNLDDGVTSKTFSIPLVDNNLVQGTVNFSVQLSNPGGGAVLVSPTNANVAILDNDVGVDFVNATNYVSETNGTGLVFVQRIGDAANAFNVNYATTNGTAMAGVNYQATAGTLSFASGESLKAISIPLINTHGVTNVAFGMSLSTTNPQVQVVVPSNAVVIIQPANAGLSFVNPAISVFKNGGAAVITVVCSNPGLETTNTNSAPLSVNYFTSDGTGTGGAVNGVDYLATSGTLLFTNGLVTNTFTVPIINNSQVTSNRYFTVSLTNATAPGKITSPSNQVVTIIDSNSGLGFSASAYSILKTGIAAPITVLRTDNTNQTSSVNFTTLDGTAVAGMDYIATNGTFVFTNGETSKTFMVTVIANTAVQPDKTVLLQLFSPTNGVLVAPSAATLTIHDTTGSLVVPDGSVLTNESFAPPNDIIDPGETVWLIFAFRAEAGTNIANFSATLLATNGVTSPSPVGAMNPTSLTVGGRPALQAFKFTASGTNGQQIAATFQLYNGASSIGTAVFTYSLGTLSTTYYNTNAITINDNTTASPYPSTINIGGLSGVIIKATVTLTNMYHGSASDIGVLLAAPNQQNTLLMSHAGGPNAISKVTLVFDDASTNTLPDTASGKTITSGTNKPTAYGTAPHFP